MTSNGTVGFEGRLLVALTELDATRTATAPERRPVRRRRPLVIGSVVGAAVLLGGASAVAAIVTSQPTLQGAQRIMAGMPTTLKGSGCAAGAPVTLDLDGARLGAGTADADGAFAVTTMVPVDTEPGRHTVTSRCAGDGGPELAQTMALDVVAAGEVVPIGPALSAGGTVTPGGTALVKGSGCRPGTPVQITVDTTPSASAPTTADATGTFIVTFVVPASTAPGTYRIDATCPNPDGAGLNQTADLMVIAA